MAAGRGFMPGTMRASQWSGLAQKLQQEAFDDLQLATLAERTAAGNRAAGRQFIGGDPGKRQFIQLGGQVVERQWAGGSAKEAARRTREINIQTKTSAANWMTEQLMKFGFGDIRELSFDQKRRLLAEIGHGVAQKNNIGGVSRAERERIIAASRERDKLNARSISINPRAGPGLEKWGHYEMAMVKAGRVEEIEYPPATEEVTLPGYVTTPGELSPEFDF